MVCVLEDASPARGERPSSEISGVVVYEGGIVACVYSIECFDILGVCERPRGLRPCAPEPLAGRWSGGSRG